MSDPRNRDTAARTALNEKATLGGLLWDNPAIDEVNAFLVVDDFASFANQKLYQIIVATWVSGRPVNAVSLAEEVRRNGLVEEIGGYGYIGDLVEADPTGAHVLDHARAVHEQGVLRQLILVATEILREAYDPVKPAEDIVVAAERSILAIGDRGSIGGPTPLAKPMDEAIERLQERQERGQPINGLTTTLRDLDELVGGFRPGELIVLAARPGVGKSSLGLQIGHRAAAADSPVFLASLEMGAVELSERLLCTHGRVASHHFRSGLLTEAEMDRILAAHERNRDAPVWIDDRSGQNVGRFIASTRRLKRRANIGLAVLDYLQLLHSEDRRVPRTEQIADMTRRLKCCAREMNVPILVLSQLNREAETSGRPRLAHLRESGAIEQDSDVVLLMWPNEQDRSEVFIDVAKNRNGPTGLVTVRFRAETTSFEDNERSPWQG